MIPEASTADSTRARRRLALAALALVLLGSVAVGFTLRADRGSSTGIAAAPPDAAESERDENEADDNDDNDGTRALLGEVLAAPDGRALVGVEVRAVLVGGGTANAVTDGDGTFALEPLPRPIASLRFTAPGFLQVEVDGEALPQLKEAFWSQKLTPDGSAAQPADAIEGTALVVEVKDDRGTPVASYRLTLRMHGAGGEGGRPRPSPPVTVDVTDPRGRFTTAVTPGSVMVLVVAEGFRPGEPVVLQVEEGERAQASVVLSRSIQVRGNVTDAQSGKPIGGAAVAVAGTGAVEPAITDAQGNFVLPSVMAEDMSIMVTAEGYLELNVGGIDGARSRDEIIDVKLTPSTPGIASEVVGIGVGVAPHRDGVRVREVFASGPAAGLLEEGDVIVEVDGVRLGERRLRESVSAIRGAAGTRTRLVVRKADGSETTVDIARARVSVPDG